MFKGFDYPRIHDIYIADFHESAFSSKLFLNHQLKAMRQRVLNISTGSRGLDNILGGIHHRDYSAVFLLSLYSVH